MRSAQLETLLTQARNAQASARWGDAEHLYQAVIRWMPRHLEALHGHALALQHLGRWQESLASLQKARAIAPQDPLLWVSTGDASLALLQAPDAEKAYLKALELQPGLLEALLGLAQLYEHAGHLEKALEHLTHALTLAPDRSALWIKQAFLQREQGMTDAALESLQTALSLAPNDLEARLEYALMLPPIYRSKAEIEGWRRRYRAGLQQLHTDVKASRESLASWVPTLARRTNFYLQYQGGDDKPLQHLYGEILARATADRYPALPVTSPHHPRIRVGFVSSLFRHHTVGKLFLGFLTERQRDRVEVYTYYLGQKVDEVTELYRSHSDVFRHLPREMDSAVQTLRADALNIAVFNDLWLEDISAPLAAARIAPVQCALWGHPVTSGIPAMDYFITSALMEPENWAQHYTEKLIPLPGVGIYYPPPQLPSAPRTRAEFGLPEDAFIFLSSQTLHKYLPEDDELFPMIASRVPHARFVFLIHQRATRQTAIFRARLAQAFARFGLDWQVHCIFAPRLSHSDYLSLNLASDVLLDTPTWSGGNTTLEGLGCGKLVITLPGHLMRGRHTYAMLTAAGLPELIARDKAHYVELAVRIAQDTAWRRELVARLQKNAPGSVFCNLEPVRALETAFESMVGIKP